MTLRTPTEESFYYESTDIRDRLLFCIPLEILQEDIRQGRVNKSVLFDFPDGIDIKVSKPNFHELKVKYGLILPSSRRLYTAFQFIKKKTSNQAFPRTGFIRKDYLVHIADLLSEELQHLYPNSRDVYVIEGSKSPLNILKDKYKYTRRKNKIFEKLDLPGYDPAKPIKNQVFSEVRMSDGDDLMSIFNNINKKR